MVSQKRTKSARVSGRDPLVALQPRDLTREAVEAARQSGFLHVSMIGRQEGLDRGLHDGGAGHAFPIGDVVDPPDQLGWQRGV